MSDELPDEHEFTSSWRWTESFENWVAEKVDGFSVNVCAGLSPIGDTRVDLMTPLEIIELLQADENTDLDEAKDALSDLLTDEYIGRDVIHELYESDDPKNHPLSEYIDCGETIRTDVFSGELPFDANTFEWTVCDPPWKNISEHERKTLFSELVRITEPGGHILFNAWWVPTSEGTTLDQIRIRQDTDRYDMGTPSVSYASIYTVHSSTHSAKYLSQTFTSREFVPEPTSLQEAATATRAYELEVINGIDGDAFDIRSVGADPSHRCPHCGCLTLDPVIGAPGPRAAGDHDMYECQSCEFPVTEHELEQIANGHIQQVRFNHGFSSIPEEDLRDLEDEEPPADIMEKLKQEPGIPADSVSTYLNFALPVGEPVKESDSGLEAVISDTGTGQTVFGD